MYHGSYTFLEHEAPSGHQNSHWTQLAFWWLQLSAIVFRWYNETNLIKCLHQPADHTCWQISAKFCGHLSWFLCLDCRHHDVPSSVTMQQSLLKTRSAVLHWSLPLLSTCSQRPEPLDQSKEEVSCIKKSMPDIGLRSHDSAQMSVEMSTSILWFKSSCKTKLLFRYL